MKRTTAFFMLLAVAAGLTACTLGVPEETSDAVSLKVRTGSATRANETAGIYWNEYADSQNNVNIGVNVVSVTDDSGNSDTESGMTDYGNMGYTTVLDGTDVTSADFTAVGGDIWFDTDSKVKVTAYAPFTGTSGTLPGDKEDGIITVSTDASAQANYSAIDYIFASEVTATRLSPVANFEFSHVMAQIVLEIVSEDGSELTAADVSAYSLGGLVLSGTFDTVTGEAEADNVSRTDLPGFTLSALTPSGGADGSLTYTVLVCPQTTILTFSNGVTSKANESQTYFHGGRSYHFTATVSSDGTFAIEGGEIYEWQDYMTEYYEFSTSAAPNSVFVDDDLTITFKHTPALGIAGSIRIYSYNPDDPDEDPVLADEIDMEDNIAPEDRAKMTSSTTVDTGMQILTGDPYTADESSRRYKVVYYTPVEVNGNAVTIHPHIGALDFDTDYYVTIDEEAVSALGFSGLAADEWKFKTCGKPDFGEVMDSDTGVTVKVGKTGSDVQFRTIQRALEYMCATYQDYPVTIDIADGVYNESIFARGKNNITFHGASRDGTIIRAYSNKELYDGDNPSITGKPAVGGTVGGNPGSCIVYFDGGLTGLRFENMSMVNTAPASSSDPVILYFNCNNYYTMACVNCLFSGSKKDLYIKACAWLYDCLVEGTENYVYGSGNTTAVLFEDSEIRTVDGGSGAVCQSGSTNLGFVFLNCSIAADASVTANSVYLAAATGSGDGVAYINCSADSDVLNSDGWNTSGASVTPTVTTGFRYYNFMIGGNTAAAWSDSYVHEITPEEYAESVYGPDDDTQKSAREAIFGSLGESGPGTDWLTLPE